MNLKNNKLVPIVVVLTLAAGCSSMAPRDETPPLPVPQNWPEHLAAGTSGASAAALPWQDYFRDPVLRTLIATALDNNRDLRLAALRADEARAAFRIQRAELFPSVGANAQGYRVGLPDSAQSLLGSSVLDVKSVSVGVSGWELDLWGRVRSLEAVALQQWQATDAGRRATQLALVAQVADGYLGLRELDERVALARRTVASREDSYRIFKRRFEVGSSSKLELTQVETLLTQAQALLSQLELSRDRQLHALAQLVGADPGPLPPAAPFDESLVLAELAPGLPSDLLQARPDIVAAEHQLRAANANIGAARAAFFPRIALTGSVGWSSSELDGLFSSGNRLWIFNPSLSLPIFTGGKLGASLDVAEVRRDAAVASYEKAVQAAFRDVADALAARKWLAQQLQIARTALAAQTERARLAKLRYDNGSATYLEVLDAQRDLLAAEQQLVQARRALLSSQVALYTALGGGAPAATTETNLSR
jgi:NodT family efflux transporter outer membrane factor (OMF) lipoprotein